VFDGNSINRFPAEPNTYPTQLLMATGWRGRNVAISGMAWSQLDETSDGNPPFSRRVGPYLNVGDVNGYLMVGGIQDYLYGTVAEGMYDYQKAAAVLARSYNPNVLVVTSTTTPAAGLTVPQEAERVQGNALLLSDPDGAFAAVVDLDGLMPDYTDTTYYSDEVHLTVVGAGVAATAMAAAYAALL
jgi:hypothetical protein